MHPPANVAPVDLWTRLTQTPRPHKDFKFPRAGVDHSVRLVVLTEQELMSCRANADRFAKEQLKERQSFGDANLGYGEIYKNECVVQLVCASCRDVNGQNIASRAFPNADMARAHLTSDEFAVLFNAYCDFQTESGPLISSMTPEEMDAWIDRLAEGASRVPLAQLSSVAKEDLLMHLVSKLSKSPTDSTSPGSQPSE